MHGLVWWGVLFGAWQLFVVHLAWSESLVGAGAAMLGAAASELVCAHERPRFRPRPAWLFQVWRIPGYVLDGCWVLARRLARRIFLHDRSAGLFQLVAFDPGGKDSRSAARRALAIFYTTLPPNFVIIGIDRRHRRMLFHQVEKDEVPAVTRRLGARA